MKNAIGVFGTLAVSDPVSADRDAVSDVQSDRVFGRTVDETGLSRFMSEIGGAFGMILGMTGACALLLIISMITSISAVMPV